MDDIEAQLQESYERLANSDIVWSPQPGSQTLFMTCPIYEVLYEGTRGCMKTDSLIMDFAQHVDRGYGEAWRGILFRQTYPQLDHIIAKTKQWFHQIYPEAIYSGSPSPHWRWPTGETLLLRQMEREDDYWKYHGHEYPWVGWDEITNWPTDGCYESMKACCRSSDPRIPGDLRRFRATANPFGSGHGWVKKRFIDPAPSGTPVRNKEGELRVRIHGDISENKVLLSIDPAYIAKLDSIKDPVKKKAWRFGSWTIVAGGALDDLWDPAIHTVEPFKIPEPWFIDRSFDWGSSKPFSVGWWAESDGCEVLVRRTGREEKRTFPPKTLFRVAEFYGWNGEPNEGSRMLASEVARKIRETERRFPFIVRPGPADPSIWTVEDGDSIADKMSRQGIRWKRGDNSPGSRVAGLESLRERLVAAKGRTEDPAIYIFDTCRHFIRTIPVLPRDSKKMDDVDSSAEDH